MHLKPRFFWALLLMCPITALCVSQADDVRQKRIALRQIYDLDELLTRILTGGGSNLYVAKLTSARASGMSRDDYYSLFPHRRDRGTLGPDIGFRQGSMSVMTTVGMQNAQYAFADDYTTRESLHNRYSYSGGEWDSGYFVCYSNFTQPLFMVVDIRNIPVAGRTLEDVPPTYLISEGIGLELESVLKDWPKLSSLGESREYLEKKLQNWPNAGGEFKDAIFARYTLMLGQEPNPNWLVKNQANTLVTGLLTYRILRYGPDDIRKKYADMLLPLLNRQDVNIDGIVLGMASAYTKFEFPSTEVGAIRAAISQIDSTPANDVAAVSAQRKQLVSRLVELVDADPVPEPIRRLADALSVRIGKEEQGLRSIFREIIDKDGPQAKLRDRSDRMAPGNLSEVLPLAK